MTTRMHLPNRPGALGFPKTPAGGARPVVGVLTATGDTVTATEKKKNHDLGLAFLAFGGAIALLALEHVLPSTAAAPSPASPPLPRSYEFDFSEGMAKTKGELWKQKLGREYDASIHRAQRETFAIARIREAGLGPEYDAEVRRLQSQGRAPATARRRAIASGARAGGRMSARLHLPNRPKAIFFPSAPNPRPSRPVVGFAPSSTDAAPAPPRDDRFKPTTVVLIAAGTALLAGYVGHMIGRKVGYARGFQEGHVAAEARAFREHASAERLERLAAEVTALAERSTPR